jgi:hypothetical protein
MYSETDRTRYHPKTRTPATFGARVRTPSSAFCVGHNHQGFPAANSMANVTQRRHRTPLRRHREREAKVSTELHFTNIVTV